MKTKAKPKKPWKKSPVPTGKKEMRTQSLDPDTYYTTGIPQPEPFGSFLKSYSVHIWVYACVRAIAANIAAVNVLPYVPVKQKDGVSWEVNENHPWKKLMNQPNPYMSGYQLREYLAAAAKLAGNGYIFLEDFGGKEVREMWPLLPDAVKPVSTREKMISHYTYQVGGNIVTLPYEKVIHFRGMNPESFVYGLGDVAAAKNTIATDIFAQVWNKSFFGNAARPDAVLETEQVLEDGTRNRIIESWKAMHQGALKHGKTAILEAGLKHSKVSENAKDMDFVNLRRDLRIEILAAFGVPPSIVGLLEYANYSNMEQQTKMFWNHTLLPMLRNFEETWTIRARQILFDASGTIFQADKSTVQALQPDMKLMAETAKTFIDSGFPPNQVIDALDMPFEHIEGGDEPRQPPVPVGFGMPPDPAGRQPRPPVMEDEEDEEKRAKSLRTKEELDRIVSWKKFDEQARSWEQKMRIVVAAYFRSQRTRILRGITENASRLTLDKAAVLNHGVKAIEDTVNVIFDFDRERRIMETSVTKVTRGTYFDFALRMGRRLATDFDFELGDPVAVQWIKDKVSRLVTEANEYTLETIKDGVRDAIQEAIAEGFDQGDTIRQVKDRIESIYDFAVEGRAERIARTETISAANAGSTESMKRTGVKFKEWLSTKDSITRETHEKMDGQRRSITENFLSPSGATLAFPGDPNAPADEIINCRCTPIPVAE